MLRDGIYFKKDSDRIIGVKLENNSIFSNLVYESTIKYLNLWTSLTYENDILDSTLD